jgi:hypothetical protein
MAGRPRLPDAVAKATGAAAKNPQRFTDRKPPKVGKLGPPPSRLTSEEQDAWSTLALEIPWLGASDRQVVSVACRLIARFNANELSIGGMTELRQIMTQLGATPAARSKIAAPKDDDDEDPADAYFN